MKNYIKNLNTKPDHVKRRFAFLVSFSFSTLILIGWIASYGFQSTAVVADANNDNKTIVEAPISSITASAVGAYNDLKNIIFSSNKTEYSTDNIEMVAGER